MDVAQYPVAELPLISLVYGVAASGARFVAHPSVHEMDLVALVPVDSVFKKKLDDYFLTAFHFNSQGLLYFFLLRNK